MPTRGSTTGVPTELRHLPSTLLKIARDAADGDWRRVVFDPKDGSLTILNNPRLADISQPKKSTPKKAAPARSAPRTRRAPKQTPVEAEAPAPVEPPAPAPREDYTAQRDPRDMEPEVARTERVYQQKLVPPRAPVVKTVMPKHLSEPPTRPRRTMTPLTQPQERLDEKGRGWTLGQAPEPARGTSLNIRDRLSDAERQAAQAMRSAAPRTDKPVPPQFSVVDAWEKLDVDRVASSMLEACRNGLPDSLPLDMHADVLALEGVNFDLVVSSVRNPYFVEIAGLETKEKGFPVLRFFRGDITTVVGLREALMPLVIATYVIPQLVHDMHRPGTSKGGGGGGGARRQSGLPGTPSAVIKRLRGMGAEVDDDELKDTPAVVRYQGQELGKISVKATKQQCESDYQRIVRKMEAISRRSA